MGGIELHEGTLVVDREPNDLDELAIRFSTILDDVGIQHVFISGYIAILTGRARVTEDIDVLLEHASSDKLDRLVAALADEGLWGPAMPLDAMAEMLGDNIWIARDGEMVPHLEAKYVSDAELPIGPFELQIAYKLRLATPKDFEDAVHLYSMFEETLSIPKLEHWVAELGVEEDYERLKRA